MEVLGKLKLDLALDWGNLHLFSKEAGDHGSHVNGKPYIPVPPRVFHALEHLNAAVEVFDSRADVCFKVNELQEQGENEAKDGPTKRSQSSLANPPWQGWTTPGITEGLGRD